MYAASDPTGKRYEVVSIERGYIKAESGKDWVQAADGAYFTHERPEADSYQQLYMDMAGRGKGNGIGFREFERRARALAGASE